MMIFSTGKSIVQICYGIFKNKEYYIHSKRLSYMVNGVNLTKQFTYY